MDIALIFCIFQLPFLMLQFFPTRPFADFSFLIEIVFVLKFPKELWNNFCICTVRCEECVEYIQYETRVVLNGCIQNARHNQPVSSDKWRRWIFYLTRPSEGLSIHQEQDFSKAWKKVHETLPGILQDVAFLLTTKGQTGFLQSSSGRDLP